YQDTANSGGKKETKAMVFHKMDTEEVSDRFVAPCFVNGLEAYDEEINLGVEENMISNEYAVKLCLEHEVKRGNKIVKKELIYCTKSLRMTKAITDFEAGTITIYPDIDPFLEDTEEEEKNMYDWDQLLDFNLDDIPLLVGEELPPFEEATKEALALRISQKFALLEEVRPVLETMAYHDKYKKVLDEIWKDKVELDGMIMKEEEEAIKKVKGEALKEKDDSRAFIFPIRLEGQVNENALADTGSDINTMPYRIYEQLGREEMKKVDRGITMINHTQAEAMGILTNVLCQVGVTTLIAKFLILDIPIDRDAPIVVGRGFLRTIGGIVNTPERLFSTFDGFCHQTFRAARSDVMRNAESDSDDEEEYEIKRNKFGAPIYGPKPAPYLNCNDPAERSLALQTVTNPFRKISVWKKAVSFLGSLPVPLKHVNWKPDYKGSYTKEEEATGQWRTKIRLTDPYGNIYIQGFTTKKTDQKLSKYHKLSDIMSPNWFME
ncbi:retrovirus-related pol polyprotein from transposon TNT 1-94, partial [Tanacetum coccineum]